MEVAENIKYGKLAKLADMENIRLSALYLLASPSTPESVREEAISCAEDGEKLSPTSYFHPPRSLSLGG